MTLSNTSGFAYTISIPAPVLPGELERLAQIHVPGNKLLVVYWMRSTRQAVCSYNGKWYIQSDQNIMTGIAHLIKYENPIYLLTMNDLFIFETPGHGFAADDDLIRNFRECEWSDYGSDRLVFHCVIREKNVAEKNVVEKNAEEKSAMDKLSADIEYNNSIKNSIPDNVIPSAPVSVPVPVLTRATECCCTGCCKVMEKNIKNGK
jgi:hypothetical protein